MEFQYWKGFVKNSLEQTFEGLDPDQINQLAERIHTARRIFLMGSGRTGLITQAFGMRLAQMGLPVHIVNQPTTPALEKEDILILVSGSGNTASLLAAGSKAFEICAETHLVTQNGDSPLGKLVKEQLIVPSPLQNTKVLNGTLFELSLLIVLDAVVNQLLELTGQDYQDLTARHANLG